MGKGGGGAMSRTASGVRKDTHRREAATGIALDRFKERTDRDGAALAILATHARRFAGNWFTRLHALADARGIPLIDQYEHIARRGGRVEDAQFPHDYHWSPTGHQWAAEALLEFLKRNRSICGRRPP